MAKYAPSLKRMGVEDALRYAGARLDVMHYENPHRPGEARCRLGMPLDLDAAQDEHPGDRLCHWCDIRIASDRERGAA